ncbi:MAG: PD-(D/E)XK nuclease family protein [Anaerolineae bacterium]
MKEVRTDTQYPIPNTQYPVPNLRFSQRSLADFLICRRRFKLRYIDRLVWPAPFSQADQELEALMELGRDFHQAVHQKFVRVEPAELIAGNPDRRLAAWWESFANHALPHLPDGERWPEAALRVPMGDSWLVARFDLLVVSPSGEATIFDWKTGQLPARGELAQHMQTRVYPFVLAEAGASYSHDQPIPPDRITMAYWYAQAPDRFVEFPYSSEAHQRNRMELQALIDEIVGLPADGFPKVADVGPCRRCNYRAYCGRDVEPAPAFEMVDEEVDFLMEVEAAYEAGEDL